MADTITSRSAFALSSISRATELTMSSREIADLTGKQHGHVMRDIRTMLVELHGEVGVSKFGYTHTNQQNGQTYSAFNLPELETLTLITGYNAKLRMAVIARWKELEAAAMAAAEPKDPPNSGQKWSVRLPREFTHPSGKTLRTERSHAGEVMFNWKDICAILNFKGSNSARLGQLVKPSEVEQINIKTICGDRLTNHVTKSGLYAAALRSCKPEAAEVRIWLEREILPAVGGAPMLPLGARPIRLPPPAAPDSAPDSRELELLRKLEITQAQLIAAQADLLNQMRSAA